MFCAQCGAEIAKNGRYCSVCGRTVEAKGRLFLPRNTLIALGVVVVPVATLLAVFAIASTGSPPSANETEPSPIALVPPTDTPTLVPTVTAVPTPTATVPPPTATRVPVQVANGTEMQTAEGAGLGELTVDNGTTNDAIIKLFDPARGRSVRAVYVVRQSKWTITAIPVGVFVVRYAAGRDWDPVGRFFQAAPSFSQFEDTIDFTETPNATGTTYTTWTITLQPVAGGTAETETIDASAFAQ